MTDHKITVQGGVTLCDEGFFEMTCTCGWEQPLDLAGVAVEDLVALQGGHFVAVLGVASTTGQQAEEAP